MPSTSFAQGPAAQCLRALAWLAGLPGEPLRRRIAAWFAARERRRWTKRARIVECNLRLAKLEASLLDAVLHHTAMTLLESLRYWTRPRARNLRDVVAVEGLEVLAAAEAAGPVIVVAPHHGNWELLLQWVAARRGLGVLYTRGASPVLDRFLRLARERSGVVMVAADAHGMKPLLRILQAGGTLGITPDQVPEAGGALWSSFFGVPALTMTLIHRLAERSGARLVVAAAERRAEGGFVVRIEPAPAMTTGPVQEQVDAMNLVVEARVRRNPAQYQWTYKRYKGQRPGEAPVNPYWPECY